MITPAATRPATARSYHADGRVELDDAATAALAESPLYNHDLAPVRVADRTWTTYNYAALWISMAHCIPTYMLAAGLIAAGMSWRQALFTILLGNIDRARADPRQLAPRHEVRHPLPGLRARRLRHRRREPAGADARARRLRLVRHQLLDRRPGAAHVPARRLAVVAAHLSTAVARRRRAQPSATRPASGSAFVLFWVLNIVIVYRGMDLLRKVENWAAPFVLVMTALLVGWAIWRAHGLGAIMAQPGKFHDFGSFFKVFVPSLTAMIGFWATLSLNMPDFTRFGRSQREQVDRPGRRAADDDDGLRGDGHHHHLGHRDHLRQGDLGSGRRSSATSSSAWIVAIAMFTIVVATLSVNIAANVVSPANDFANAFPRFISFRTGGLITGIVGIAHAAVEAARRSDGLHLQVAASATRAASARSPACSSPTTASCARRSSCSPISIAPTAPTATSRGWNVAAVVATLLGCALAWIGAFVPSLRAALRLRLVRRLLRRRRRLPRPGDAHSRRSLIERSPPPFTGSASPDPSAAPSRSDTFRASPRRRPALRAPAASATRRPPSPRPRRRARPWRNRRKRA